MDQFYLIRICHNTTTSLKKKGEGPKSYKGSKTLILEKGEAKINFSQNRET